MRWRSGEEGNPSKKCDEMKKKKERKTNQDSFITEAVDDLCIAPHILHFFFFSERRTPGPLFHYVSALCAACTVAAPSRRFPAPPHLLLLRPTIIAVSGRSFRLHRCFVQSACTADAPHRRGGCSDAATASIAFV
ncbi:hypothetical protein DEO72_LG10g3454 [Vigna unguiculata]|uniref:Uncharacterized protein n=1 Tax=Vigna unguiculata TaxID=3917 RepID=A0A4D6NEB8_VIGUN|nr:hypothetical protein DEO72_LG10g3454 [Vigna unguiculata]